MKHRLASRDWLQRGAESGSAARDALVGARTRPRLVAPLVRARSRPGCRRRRAAIRRHGVGPRETRHHIRRAKLVRPSANFRADFQRSRADAQGGAAPHVGRADSSRCCGWPAGARIREGGTSSHARGCAGAIRLRGTREAAEIAEIAIRALIRLPFRGSRFCRANSTEFGRRDGCAVRWRRRARRCRTTTTSWCRASRSCVKSARISTRASLATRRRRVRCRLLPPRAARRCAR